MEKQAATGIPINQQPYPPQPGQGQPYAYHQQQTPGVGVHYQQPAQPNYQPQPGGQQIGVWSTDLFDCFDDVPLCCLTCWCPCITFGRIAEITDKGATTCGTAGALYSLILAFTGCQFIYSCTYRTRMRQQYGIPGDDVGDCCTHFWCEGCSLCQEYRELTHRGFDVSLGWYGNAARQSQQGAQMAPVPAGMNR